MSKSIMLAHKDGWRVVGPGGGGSQFAPAISPHDDAVMYISCDMSGFYRTQDAGESWLQLNLGYVLSPVVTMFHPTDANIAYAASAGVFKSVDAGRHWQLIFPDPAKGVKVVRNHDDDEATPQFEAAGWPGGAVQAMGIDPLAPDHMYVGLSCAQAYGRTGHGVVFYATENGKDFVQLFSDIPGDYVRSISVQHRGGEKLVYLITDEAFVIYTPASGQIENIPLPRDAVKIWNADTGKTSAGDVVTYLYCLFDGEGLGSVLPYVYDGDGMRACDLGFTPYRPCVLNGKCIAACANHAEVAYLTICRNGTYEQTGRYEGIMKTQDCGRSWHWVLPTTDDFPDNVEKGWMEIAYGPYWPEAPIGIGVSPFNPDIAVYTTLGTSHRTEDGGKFWKCMYSTLEPNGASTTRGMDVTTCYGYHTDPFSSKNRIISYTDIGMARSEDGGNTWHHAIKGVPLKWRNTAYWTIYDPGIKDRVYACWSNKHDLPLAKMFGYNIYFVQNYGGVCVSDDGGRSWRPTLGREDGGLCTPHILLDTDSPLEARVLYAAVCGRGVLKSCDGGETWASACNGLPERVYAFKLDKGGNGVLYLVAIRGVEEGETVPGGFYASSDGGASWQARRLPEGVIGPCDVAADPQNVSGLYLVCRPVGPPEASPGGVYYSADAGTTWQRLPLPEEYTHCVYADPEAPGRIYVTTFVNSLYRSDDGGHHWKRLGGFNFRAAQKPSRDPDNGDMIYVPCFGSSVWHGPSDGSGCAYEDVYPFIDDCKQEGQA